MTIKSDPRWADALRAWVPAFAGMTINATRKVEVDSSVGWNGDAGLSARR